MFVDESGDSGLQNSPTRCFVLTGLVIHELRWQLYLDEIIRFRHHLRQKYGLRLREEFHASAFLNHPGDLIRIKRHDRLAMIRHLADFLASLSDLNLINVAVDKQGKPANYSVFQSAWRALFQRFENTLSHRNFPGPANPDEKGIIFCDHTEDKKLMQLLRQMRRWNPVPSQPHHGSGYRNLPLNYILEDPNFRDSAHSYFIQAADLTAFLLYQHLAPSAYMRKNAGHNYFTRLKPILCLHAAPRHPNGMVWL